MILTSTVKTIIIGIFIVLIILGITLLTMSWLYRSKDIRKQKNKKRRRFIIGFIMLMIGIIGIAGVMLFWSKILAKKILIERDSDTYSKLCDELFETTASEPVMSDYLMMKAQKTIKEVQNLCGNYAKTLLNQK